MQRNLMLAGLGVLALAAPLRAQQTSASWFVEARGGAVVPTFDIADVARIGSSLGATLGYRIDRHWEVFGEFDYGMHKDKTTGTASIHTLHYLGKVGYSLTGPREHGWDLLVNLGAGAVAFDVANAPTTHTYFAINAGAKLDYNFSGSIALVLSPQGDVAFSKRAELTTTNAWVWPFTAGLRLTF